MKSKTVAETLNEGARGYKGINPKYTHFAVRKTDDKIVTGWEYKGIDKEELQADKEHYFYFDLRGMEVAPKTVRIMTAAGIVRKLGIDPFNQANWAISVSNVDENMSDDSHYDLWNDTVKVLKCHKNPEVRDEAKMLIRQLNTSAGSRVKSEIENFLDQYLPELTTIEESAKSKGKCPATGCTKKVDGKWRVVSNKTGKLWPAHYKTEQDAKDALAAYHVR